MVVGRGLVVTDDIPPVEADPSAVSSAAESSRPNRRCVDWTVRERLSAAGLSAERIAQHLPADRVRADGELVNGLDQAAPEPARVTLRAP